MGGAEWGCCSTGAYREAQVAARRTAPALGDHLAAVGRRRRISLMYGCAVAASPALRVAGAVSRRRHVDDATTEASHGPDSPTMRAKKGTVESTLGRTAYRAAAADLIGSIADVRAASR